MSVSMVGKHLVSSCPYCDKLLTVQANQEEQEDAWHELVTLLQLHLEEFPDCKERHQKSVRHIFGALALNPLTVAFFNDVFPQGQEPLDSDLLDVAKITRTSAREPYFIEASELSALSTILGTDNKDPLTIEWVRMTVAEFEALPLLNRPATKDTEAAVHSPYAHGDGR
jgi:hypothetical protein